MMASKRLLTAATIACAVATAFAGSMHGASADNNTIGVQITSDREPSNFADPKNTTFELNGAHTVNSGWNFNTPQVATGVSFKLDEQRTITTKIMRNWRDGSPSSTGVAVGFKQGF